MLKYYWYISTFFRKHGILVLTTIIAAVLLFSFAFPLLLRTFEFKKKSYIGLVGRYTLTNLPQQIQNEVSSGLTLLSDDGTATPDLSERWSIEDDGKTYRFVIKKNIFWQDGKELIPSAVNYNFNDVQLITTTNDVVFKLKDNFSPFPVVVSQPLFRFGTESYLFFFKRPKLIGLGKYQVIDYKEDNQRLTEIVVSGPSEIKTYRFYLTEDDAVSAFKRGEVDVLPNLSSPADLSSWNTVTITPKLDKQTYLGVFFNASDPLLSTNEFRVALNYAVKKPTDDTRAYGPISPTSWAYSNVGKPYDYDIDRATERLLSGLKNFNQPIHFEMVTSPIFATEANDIKSSWLELGNKAADQCQKDSTIKDKANCQNLRMSVDIRITNFPDTNNYQVMLVGEQSPVDPDQYNLWHSNLPTNFTNYSNTRIDKLLEDGRQIEDQKKRFENYQEFQQFFSEDAPVVFIRHLTRFDITRKGKI